MDNAKAGNMPADNITRAIKKGTGELESVSYEEIAYEGYGPGGAALLVQALTDNRNRTGSEVRSLLSKNGGSLAEPGAVAWQFERKGVVLLDGTVDEDEIMVVALDAGAEDLVDEDGTWRLTCEATDLSGVREALEAAEVPFLNAEVTMLATTTVAIDNAEHARAVLRLLDILEDNDDIQDVHANFDIPADVMEALED